MDTYTKFGSALIGIGLLIVVGSQIAGSVDETTQTGLSSVANMSSEKIRALGEAAGAKGILDKACFGNCDSSASSVSYDPTSNNSSFIWLGLISIVVGGGLLIIRKKSIFSGRTASSGSPNENGDGQLIRKLHELESLRSRKLISEDEFVYQRKKLLDDSL